MKIIIEDIGPDEEEQVIIWCRKLSDPLIKLLSDMEMEDKKIAGIKDGAITMLDPKTSIILKAWIIRYSYIARTRSMKPR